MRFTAAALFGFAGLVLGQSNPTDGYNPMTKPATGEVLTVGETYTIEWQTKPEYTGACTITLIGGTDSAHLVDLEVLTAAKPAQNQDGKFEWVVSQSGQQAYGFRINDAANPAIFQWSNSFKIQAAAGGGAGGASTTAQTTSPTTGVPESTKTNESVTKNDDATTTATDAQPTVEPTKQSNWTTKASSTLTTLTTPSHGAGHSNATVSITTDSGSHATSTGTGASTSSTTPPTAGAASTAAGTFAMLGGLAVAMLAL